MAGNTELEVERVLRSHDALEAEAAFSVRHGQEERVSLRGLSLRGHQRHHHVDGVFLAHFGAPLVLAVEHDDLLVEAALFFFLGQTAFCVDHRHQVRGCRRLDQQAFALVLLNRRIVVGLLLLRVESQLEDPTREVPRKVASLGNVAAVVAESVGNVLFRLRGCVVRHAEQFRMGADGLADDGLLQVHGEVLR